MYFIGILKSSGELLSKINLLHRLYFFFKLYDWTVLVRADLNLVGTFDTSCGNASRERVLQADGEVSHIGEGHWTQRTAHILI